MRKYVFIVLTSICSQSYSQVKPFITFGLDWRQSPVDIEDVPRGGVPSPKVVPYNQNKFWKATSIHGSFGFASEKKWLFSASLYARHNHFHYLDGLNLADSISIRTKEKKNFKYDCFIDIEKKLRLKKNKERYFTVLAGLGFTNINTKHDVVLADTYNGDTTYKHYKGTMRHFSPRLSLGYQYNQFKISIDTYIIEGPDFRNLTSLWLGATISYELMLNREKENKKL